MVSLQYLGLYTIERARGGIVTLRGQTLKGQQQLYAIAAAGVRTELAPLTLPVPNQHIPSAHDAVAVQKQHQDWAKEMMLETWQEHLDGVGTKVKVDLP